MTTIIDEARLCWPGASDEALEALLWETTCFPCGTVDQALQQLRESYARHSGNVTEAIEHAYAEISRILREHREKYGE